MKKIISLYKNGTKYQVGELSAEEVAQIKSDISTVSGIAEANASEILDLKTNKQEKLTAGYGIDIDNLNTISVTLDTEVFVIPVDGQLPDEGIPNKIYLIPMLDTDADNKYVEYMWIVSETRWEKIGEKQIETDLSDYYKKSETYSKEEVDGKVAEASHSEYLTQAQYDALAEKKSNVDYYIYVETE